MMFRCLLILSRFSCDSRIAGINSENLHLYNWSLILRIALWGLNSPRVSPLYSRRELISFLSIQNGSHTFGEQTGHYGRCL